MACSGSCGIGAAREVERRHAMAAAALAYPTLLWSAVPQMAAPFAATELRAIADAIDEVVAAWQTLDLHDDGGATLRLEAQFGETVADTASSRLEVVFSPLGRFVTLREVRVVVAAGVRRDEPVLGVADRRWAGAVKALQGLLRERSVTLLDMAFLGTRVDERAQPAYESLYDATVTWWALLFRPEPPEQAAVRGAYAVDDGTAATP